MNGWIILDKPSGMTSAHAVAKVKRLLKAQKIGHAGTLDPLASGVLPLALGEATKTVPYMMDADKAYGFTVVWGEERDTDDSEGKVVSMSEKRPTMEEIQVILPEFTGAIQQMPPCYSAIKVDGERAYNLARRGQEVALKAREVRVFSLSLRERVALHVTDEGIDRGENPNPGPLLETKGTAAFLCHCGKGTYIRSLARDMGRRMGCLGYISVLRRLKVGKFNEKHAISLAKLEEMVHKGDLGFLQPVASALDDIPAVSVTAHQADTLKRGQSVMLSLEGVSGTVAAFSGDILIAICELSQGDVKPRRVFNL